MKLPDKTLSLIQRMIDEGYVSKRKHPSLDIYILNYTAKCQIEWLWNEATIMCRGLIVDDEWGVVARPFPKFFTPDQWKELRNYVHHLYGVKYKTMFHGQFEVTEKMDGSLGILYHDGNDYAIATRGSFESDQAIQASKFMKNIPDYGFETYEYTYLFEIIYPENRIVVNYDGFEGLVFLEAINNTTGKHDVEETLWARLHLNHAKPCPNITSLADPPPEEDAEGYVFRFVESDIRVKVKSDWYKRMHKIMTGLNERHIWEWLRNEDDWRSKLEDVPDEFFAWVQETVEKFAKCYEKIEKHVDKILKSDIIDRSPPLTRKQLAIKYEGYTYRGILFAKLDNKEYKQSIWRLVRHELLPKGEKNG